MSDSNPPDQPYGQQPYGQQPYGQSSSPYGQQPTPPYGGPPAPSGDPDRRPGTVTAAAITTIVMSALAFLLFGGVALMMLVLRDDMVSEIEKQLRQENIRDFTGDELATIVIVTTLAFALWALVALVLAVLAMRRSQVARTMLVVSAAVTALVCVPTVGSVVSVVPFLAAVAVIVLLFTGGANEWYARRGQPGQGELPTGTTQPWG
ncbi:hypothetical protein [Nocardioides dongkuii]|uniref:hypothetical protein n=1 Tax=Nocardioides dongkuii TaxID=2760089 RepID=UPI0015FD4752|nr:hypothetical protein [Nocardioides dongkuii]